MSLTDWIAVIQTAETPAAFSLPACSDGFRRRELDLMSCTFPRRGTNFAFYTLVGGLLSYGSDNVTLHRQGATYVDKIFQGAPAGELPVQQLD